ncbi:MAG: hypothetical protein Q4C22_04155, partial [Bacillota bacterium]|nr:hypothetical protein [Bacillota bacterium]
DKRDEQGCVYCKQGHDLPEHMINGEPNGRIYDVCIDAWDGNWYIEQTNGVDIGIQYCPICGRKLEGERDE